MICPKCGTEYGANVSVCSYCNETLISVAQTAVTNPVPLQNPKSNPSPLNINGDISCPTCGKANSATATCCENCGSDFFQQPVSQLAARASGTPVQTPATNQGEKICPTCSQSNPLTAVACSFCGQELKASSDLKSPGTDFIPVEDTGFVTPINTNSYPNFKRSPRVGVNPQVAVIELGTPPKLGDKPHMNWLAVLLPPAIMVGVAILSMILSGGSLTTLLFIVPMTLVTLVTSIITYLSQKKKYKEKASKQRTAFDFYKKEVKEEINRHYTIQQFVANTANPSTSDCLSICENRERRLWDRLINDYDFLDVKLGMGSLPLASEIKVPKATIGEEDELLKEAEQVKQQYSIVKDIAITLPLKTACTVGFIGHEVMINKVVANALVQLATHHSYTDLKIVLITNSNDFQQWAWLRWLPHIWENNHSVRNIAIDEAQAGNLLERFETILTDRADKVKGDGNEITISPYYLFVITDPKIVDGRKLIKILSKNHPSISAGAFYLFGSAGLLPKECNYLVELDTTNGSVFPRADAFKKIHFTPDSFDEHERFSREMAPILDTEETKGSQMPTSVTFFEGFGVHTVEEFDILRKWEQADAIKSLSVPIGTQENGKPFYIDIHEKKHGVHGLVAGMPGSGKSEILQTWILAMCLSYSPQDVSFVLIDFKGMGLAGTLQGLPHTAGIISNIGVNIERNMVSLKSELDRRQKLFASVSTPSLKIGDIYDYQAAYRSGHAKKPLSHLIIVVDEFAELKAQFPDFMQAIESASRVGRSLGVHLVLATQKPSGNISDAIQDNTFWRWCLRVANEGESREVIRRPEAGQTGVSIPPGRAFVQVGNNEIFECVQSYWSGAKVPNTMEASADIGVALLGIDGKRDVIGKKSSSPGNKSSTTQLSALVNYIASAHKAAGLTPAEKVWQDELRSFVTYESSKCTMDTVNLGVYDDLVGQIQPNYQIDLADGNIMIVGKALSGKTVLIQSIIRGVAENNTPSDIAIYILDFASETLKAFSKLNHVGGVVVAGEDEKLKNLFKLLQNEIDNRRDKFSDLGIPSFAAYKESESDAMPRILLIVENLTAFRETYPDYEDAFSNICREGLSVGITVIVTAKATQGFYRHMNNFSSRIALNCTNVDEYNAIFDRCRLRPSDTEGRGIVSIENSTYEFQAYLPFEGNTETEKSRKVKSFISDINKNFGEHHARAIPSIPAVLTKDFFIEQNIPFNVNGATIGLSYDELEPINIDLFRVGSIGILGREKFGKSNLTRSLLKYLVDRIFEVNAKAYIIDGYDHQLDEFKEFGFVEQLSVDCSDFADIVQKFSDEVKSRADIRKYGGNLEEEPLLLCIVQNAEIFTQGIVDKQTSDTFKQLLSDARGLKICFLFSNLENLGGYTAVEMLKHSRELNQYFILEDISNQRLLTLNLSPIENRAYQKKVLLGDGYSYNQRDGIKKIKLIKTEEVMSDG